MKKINVLAVLAGVAALAACNNSAQEQAADNLEANAEMTADNLEAMADNAGTDAGADALENQADATRDAADNKAEDLRTNDADTNLANGM